MYMREIGIKSVWRYYPIFHGIYFKTEVASTLQDEGEGNMVYGCWDAGNAN